MATAFAAASPVDKIHPTTYESGKRDKGNVHAWIFFTCKAQSLARGAAEVPVTNKALERRERRGVVSLEEGRELDRRVDPEFIRQVQATGAVIRRESRWLNAVSVRATPEQLESVAQFSFVTQIEPVRQLVRPPLPATAGPSIPGPPAMSQSNQLDYGPSYNQLALMNVPALHDRGYSGKNIIVLMLDTGFYKEHEAIQPDRILDEYDFLENDRETQNETIAEDSVGQHSHGTYTYTALGGNSPGYLIGPAYECSFLLAKTESIPGEFQGEEDNYVAGLEWGEALGADIVSSSLGYLYWYEYEDLDGQTAITTRAVLWATRLGMLVVTAAGNQRNSSDPPGWGGYIIAPADADSIIAVGAVDSKGQLTSFSSHGPTYDGRIKPEVVAQGVSVSCASPSGPAAYTHKSGTSLATPLVAGSAALLFQAHPTWRPADARTALMATSSREDRPDNDYGWGIPDLLAALNYHAGKPAEYYALQIEKAYPNPFQVGTKPYIVIEWTKPYRSAVKLDVYNLLGQHVVNLYVRPSKAPGPGTAVWPVVDAKGRRVPSGIYLVRLTDGRGTTARRITVQ
ncbi:MAG: S8 family serine peptidase [Candidatus Neomarinimicrobiota bacterium]